MSFKICQVKTAERQRSKVVYTVVPGIAMHYTTNSFNSTHFYTHRVEFGVGHDFFFLHRCHKVMRAVQSHRLSYILKEGAGEVGVRWEGGDIQVVLLHGSHVMAMK